MKFNGYYRPEDFAVDEISCLPLRPRGPYGAYRLEKHGEGTLEALSALALKARRPLQAFAHGGLTDPAARSSQSITVEGKRLPEGRFKNHALTFQGWMDRPMGPDLIQSNRFTVTVRALAPSSLSRILEEASAAESRGVPNYFDDFSLAAAETDQGFFAEKILKGHLNGALKLHVTGLFGSESSKERERRIFLFDHWRDWKTCLGCAASPWEKSLFHALLRRPGDFLTPLLTLRRDEILAHVIAYEAFVWNEVLRRHLKIALPGPFRAAPGRAGDYLFYDVRLPGTEALETLRIPTLSAKTKMPGARLETVYQEILRERGVERAMFNRVKLRAVHFKPVERSAMFRPESFESEPCEEGCHAGKTTVTLRFGLPPGSSGAMLLKYLLVGNRREDAEA